MTSLRGDDEVVGEILAASAAAPLVVAVDGAGGSGKSTFAARLAARIPGSVVIPLDDYLLKERMDDDRWDDAWDRERLVREVLGPLRAGQPAVRRRLDWVSESIVPVGPLAPPRVLIVEGITALHPDLAAYVGYGIWIETPAELARDRGRARDAGNENEARWDAWAANDARYRAEFAPDARADAIVDGSGGATVPG